MTIVWRTNGDIKPVVKFGPMPGEWSEEVSGELILKRVSTDVAATMDAPFGSVPLLYDEPIGLASERSRLDPNPSTQSDARQYEAKLIGLAPNTKYYYAVFDGEEMIAGGDEEHYLQTSPEHGSEADLRLWIVGDSGTGGGDQRRVFEAMEAFAEESGRRPDLYLHVGDMAYGDGADREFQRNFFEVYQRTLRHTVCWPAMGNHEGHTSRGMSQFGPYYDAYVLPTAAEAGGLASGTEAYYSFDVADVHFVCLDSHDLDRTATGSMAEWLQADLEQTEADWLIAFWHHPPYTKGSHDSDRERQLIEMRTYIMPLLEAGGVDIVLTGHSHIYERSMLMDGAYATPTTAEGVILDDGDGRPEGDGAYRKSAGLAPHNGTVQIVTGHGGAGVSRKGTMPVMREIIVEHGSTILDVKGDTLNGMMIDKRGATRDTFTIVKRGVVEHQVVENPWQPKHDPSQITEVPIAWDKGIEGATPPDWDFITGQSEQMLVEHREGTPYYQAAIAPAGSPFLAVYNKFEDRVSELQAYFEIEMEGQSPAGLVLGWVDPENYYCFEIDPTKKRAAMIRVIDGERHIISAREIELAFNRPIKIELEPVQRIVEVQLNDDLEYTVSLEEGLPKGRIGVASHGASVNVAGVTIERLR